jgi:O-antigen ligase/polysaccharide polymerase Wzy-like membrane protein
MSDDRSKTLLVLLGGAATVAFVLFMRPAYFADYSVLGAALATEIIFLTLLKYRKAFFPVLLAAFLLAGTALPYHSTLLYARWFVLALGAVSGVLVYMRVRAHAFGLFHLVAFFCILSAIVSALVSAYPDEALLKALSLMLLFTYAACGGRAAVSPFQPQLFFDKLLIGCEILNGLTVLCYLILRWEFFGNPNSLGAVLGVVVVPMMLWGFITAETAMHRRRLGAGLIFALLLLMGSYARAGILAAVVSSLMLCVASRQYRLLIKGIALSIVLALAAVMFVPQPKEGPQWDGSETVSAKFLYKGHQAEGIWGSRRSVWGQTWDAIQESPWFGTGFGTSLRTDAVGQVAFAKNHVDSFAGREHGNSYLAITEWVGLLGVVPFYSLIILTCRNVFKVFSRTRKTGDVFSPAVAAAAVVAAGLVHAAFEDWMFAVGYYLCVFYWPIAFILVDVGPRSAPVYSPDASLDFPTQEVCATPALPAF